MVTLGRLSDPTLPVWKQYPKFGYLNRWEDYRMKIDGWEYPILREIKGNLAVERVSASAYHAIRPYGDFFLESSGATYIRVFGSQEQSILLPRYANNKLMIMEFCKQVLYLRNNFWKKKDATFHLSIVIGEYTCTKWKEVESTAKEIYLYDFSISEL